VPQPAVSMRNTLREQKAWNSLDQLMSLCDKERRHFETKRLGGLEIDHQLELRRLLDGQVGGLRAFQDLVHEKGSTSEEGDMARAAGNQTPSSGNSRKPYIIGRRLLAARAAIRRMNAVIRTSSKARRA